jgi:hypothetical protein
LTLFIISAIIITNSILGDFVQLNKIKEDIAMKNLLGMNIVMSEEFPAFDDGCKFVESTYTGLSKDGKTLTIDYPISKINLTSSIEIKSSNGIINKEVFENDDMLRMALEYYYTSLSQDNIDYTTCRYCPENWALLVIEALLKE